MADPAREVLISLCERALAGEVTLDDFERAWPEPVQDPDLAPLRETLEDGIEHVPGHLLRRGVNLRVWRRSPEFAQINSFLQHLRSSEG
jgi:hypothetical protein